MAEPDPIALGDALYRALRTRVPVPPLKGRVPGLTVELAYRVSERILARRIADGERVVGKKIGVTSAAVQDLLGVHQPDFGTLTDAMRFDREMPISRLLIQPRVEGEIAFTLGAPLRGPGVTDQDVLDATASVHPCFEVVDSRIQDWRIAIEDTVADNASSGMFALGPGVSPRAVDLIGCRMVVVKNGVEVSRGIGANTVGSPLRAVAWLADTLGRFGVGLEAGEIVLSGSLVPLEPVAPGDHVHLTLEGAGEVSLSFV